MKHLILLLTLFVISTSIGQEKSSLVFGTIKTDIIERLYKVEALDSAWVMNLNKEKYSFHLKGLQNGLENKELQIGIYGLTLKNYTYFVLVEKNNYILLDFRTRHGLDLSLINLIDFCERNKYCVEITNDYVSRLLRIYNDVHKNLNRGFDINCERGIKNTKGLP
nr:hypothetical protein [uncultured Flavobacterium sp.]